MAEKSSREIASASAAAIPLKLRLDTEQEPARPASIIFWQGVGACLCEVDISVAAAGLPWAPALAGAAMAKDAATIAQATSTARQRRAICSHGTTARADAASAILLLPSIRMTPMCRMLELGANDFSVIADRIFGLESPPFSRISR